MTQSILVKRCVKLYFLIRVKSVGRLAEWNEFDFAEWNCSGAENCISLTQHICRRSSQKNDYRSNGTLFLMIFERENLR